MNKVLHLADDFAIMRRGKPSKYEPEKELRALLDLHPGKACYQRQIRTFLEQFGNRYDYGSEPFEVRACSDADRKRLQKLGFDAYVSDRGGETFLSMVDASDSNTFIVCLHGTQSSSREFDSRSPQQGSVNAIRDSLAYMARLALYSQGLAGAPTFEKAHEGDYYFDAPWSIHAHTDIPTEEGFHLTGVYDGKETQQPENLCWVTEESRGGDIKLRVRGYFDIHNDGKEDELAAFLLFLTLTENYRGGAPKYDVNPKELSFKVRKNLAETLRECFLAGQVRACAWCGEPVIGRSDFCRGTRCQPNYNEKAKRETIRNGYTRNDVEEHFPALKKSALDNWFGK